MAKFDAYTATSPKVTPEDFLEVLRFDDSCEFDTARPQRFWGNSYHVRKDGLLVGTVQWGGQNDGLVMLEVKGENTPAVVASLREAFPEHRCTRVDSCEDFNEKGAFDALLAVYDRVKARYGIKGAKQGDWEDFPEDGRTRELGARTSPIRARLYEKGLQPEYRHITFLRDWVRSELQVRPQGEAAKLAFAKASPIEVWGASPFARDLAAEILLAEVAPFAAGKGYRMSQRDRALQHMCKQYGGHLAGLLAELGSWQAVGLQLGDIVAETRSKRI